ncbi:MAG: glycosyltransferase [Nitrospiraceae bacterium]
MAMLRVGIDGESLRQDVRWGMGAMLHEASRAGAARGWDCIEYGPPQLGDESPLLASLHQAHRSVANLWRGVDLSRRLRRDKVDVWVTSSWMVPVGPWKSVIAMYDLSFLGQPDEPRTLSDWAQRQWARCQGVRAACVVTGSTWAKSRLVQDVGIPAERIAVVPMPIRPVFERAQALARPPVNLGLNEPYILTVGDFRPENNLLRLVEAYCRLSPTLRGRYRLVLAGPTNVYASALARTIATWGIADRVHFAGPQAERQLPELIAGASLCMWPGFESADGAVAVDALACGTPIVAAEREAMPEWLGNAALWIAPTQVDSMTAAMTRGLTDELLRERLRREAQAQAQRLSLSDVTNRLMSVVEAIAAMKPYTARAKDTSESALESLRASDAVRSAAAQRAA